MESAVQTARLVAHAATRKLAFGPYSSVTLTDAEDDASAIQGAFDSIQPPDGGSDRLRERLDTLLSEAVTVITDLRIAARRHQLDRLQHLAKPLADLGDRLDRFYVLHRP
jgi:hypothetical protein